MKAKLFSAINSGFTLIELLVVVLIIGILAAVALPQYTRTVERSRSAEALSMLKAITESHLRYGLENGTTDTAPDIEDLDITVPGTPHETDPRVKRTNMFSYRIGGGIDSIYINSATRLNSEGVGLGTYVIMSTQNSGRYICCWKDDKYSQICPNLGFNKVEPNSWSVDALGCRS